MRGFRSRVVALSLLIGACGGKSQQPVDGGDLAGGSGGSNGSLAGNGNAAAGNGSAGAGSVGGDAACAETPRTAEDVEENELAAEMASRALPETPVPLLINLIAVDGASGAPQAEKEKLYDPYQTAIEQRLQEIGATGVGRFAFSNVVSATVEAQYLPELLCWPYVVSVSVDAAYWEIAVPPWAPNEAGTAECPLVDGQCPEHCFELRALPYLDVGETGGGCFIGRELVACSRAPIGIDDADYACREQVSTGKPYLFTVEPPPAAPAYLGWRDCENPEPVLCDDEG
jgi:hypothetical protein